MAERTVPLRDEVPGSAPVPYRGLESYRAEDARYYFGREKLVARLVALVTSVASAGPVVLVGPSGCGKSSALGAGLAARLRDTGSWEIVSFVPGPRPLASLDAAMTSVRELGSRPGAKVALIVDQFEELFTLGAPAAERDAFARRLTDPAPTGAATGPAVSVIIALRADFYGVALGCEALGRALQDRQIVVGPMTDVDLRRAVTEPARAAGVRLDPGLVELVVHDPGELPLLSFALRLAWLRGGRDGLTLDDYLAVGGSSGAVRTAADAVHDGLSPKQRELARRLFVRLVAVAEKVPDTRRGVAVADLVRDDPAHDGTSEVIARFAEAGLLTVDGTEVTIAHEAILPAWPRLRDWTDAERTGLITRRRLAEAARAWERDGRDPRVLLTGTELDLVRAWADDPVHSGALDAVQRALVDASTTVVRRKNERVRRRALRARAVLVSASVLAVVASGVAGLTTTRWSLAAGARDDALSRQLAGTAQRLRTTDPTVAAQFAVRAWRTARTSEARSALADASAAPIARRVEGPGGAAVVAVSANGRVLAAAGNGGGLRIWTLGEGDDPAVTEVGTVFATGGKALRTVALDPEGTVMVAAGASGVLYGWDLRTPEHPQRLPEAPLSKASITGLTFSGDGHTLAVATGDGRVILYDARPGAGNATLTAIGKPLAGTFRGSPVRAVALSPDGRTLAAVAGTGRVQLWSLADRARPRPAAAQPSTGAVVSLAFSPDGRRLAAGSRDQMAYVWQVARPGAAPQRFEGAGNRVDTVTFSPDGTKVAVGGADGRVRVHEVTTRAATTALPHPGPVTSAIYLRDGRTVVTGSADGVVRLWPAPGSSAGARRELSPDAAATMICTLTGTPPRREEWERYLPGVPYVTPCP